MHLPLRSLLTVALSLIGLSPRLPAQPQMENLGRGVVAIHQPDGKVAVSWRLLGSDPEGVAFHLYRRSEPLPGGRGGSGRSGPAGPVRLNPAPLT
jgi:rhamnogalacturonan endolyase